MNPIFQEEARLIREIQSYLSGLDDRAVSQILNKEFFYHASNELSSHMPAEPASSPLLARKILQQLAPRPDYDQILDQIQHRLKVLADEKGDQLQEVRAKFEKDREKMRACGARVRDYADIYEEELRDAPIPNSLAKKAIGYFEASREWSLEEMLGDLIGSLQPQQQLQGEGAGQEEFDEEARAAAEGVLEQLRLMESCFNFSS